jgi:hypothetical protein
MQNVHGLLDQIVGCTYTLSSIIGCDNEDIALLLVKKYLVNKQIQNRTSFEQEVNKRTSKIMV